MLVAFPLLHQVMRFYSSMGKVMGDKLTKMGAAAPVKPQ